jgi:NTE family protein
MPSKFPFKNLVFQGGGVKTFAYHGALRVLEEDDVLQQIERVGGTSAGALLAVLLSFRLSVDDLVALLRTVDYSLIAKAGRERKWPHQTPKVIEHELDRVMGSLDALTRMVRHYGWHTHEYARGWLEETIATYCQGNARATFADFERLGFRKPYVVATNLSTHSVEVFSVDTTPDVAVADTVVLSGSIPLYFEAPRFDGFQLGKGDYYTDGGVLLNYPLEVFDTPHYESGNRHFVYGINWETLGCRHYTPKDCPRTKRPIRTIIQYATNLFETLAEAQIIAYENDLSDQLRTINISNCGVAATDFEIRPEEGNPTYQALVRAGEKAAREYLEQYHLPTDRLYDVKSRFAEFLQNWRPEMPRWKPSS